MECCENIHDEATTVTTKTTTQTTIIEDIGTTSTTYMPEYLSNTSFVTQTEGPIIQTTTSAAETTTQPVFFSKFFFNT